MSAFSSKAQNPSKVTEDKVRRHHSILISLCIKEFEIGKKRGGGPRVHLRDFTNKFILLGSLYS